MSKNIPKPIVRIGYIKKDGSSGHEIDGNRVKNMSSTQFANLMNELNRVRRNLARIRDKHATLDGGVLTEKQYVDIEELIKGGFKLKALKLYKEYTGFGLKECKTFVDNLEKSIV